MNIDDIRSKLLLPDSYRDRPPPDTKQTSRTRCFHRPEAGTDNSHPIWSSSAGWAQIQPVDTPVHHLDWGREGRRVDQSRISPKSPYFHLNWILSSLLSSLETVQPNGQTDQPAQTDWSDPTLVTVCGGSRLYKPIPASRCFKIRFQLTWPISTNQKPSFPAVWSFIRSNPARSLQIKRISARSAEYNHIWSKFLRSRVDQSRVDQSRINPKSGYFRSNRARSLQIERISARSVEYDRPTTDTKQTSPTRVFHGWRRVRKFHTWSNRATASLPRF